MTNEEREILSRTWELVKRQRELINQILPTAWDVADCMIAGRKPTPEQVSEWERAQTLATDKMQELSGAMATLQQLIDPLFRFDT
jgi:hypothetical protein